MPIVITSNLQRLSLHDSSFERIGRTSQAMELTFDWAKLDSFDEQGIDEPIIMGKTILSLTGVHSEQFRFYADNENYSLVTVPDDLITGLSPIGRNELDDEGRRMTISGVYISWDNQHKWVEWIFYYATCQLSWISFVTHTDWMNGKLPAD